MSQNRREFEEEKYNRMPCLVLRAQANDEETRREFCPNPAFAYLLMSLMQNRLEFALRLQQCVELRRNAKVVEARQHARKYLTQHAKMYPREVNRAAGLLAFPPDTQVPEYKVSPVQETVRLEIKICRCSIQRRGGIIWRIYSFKPITNCSLSLHDRFYT